MNKQKLLAIAGKIMFVPLAVMAVIVFNVSLFTLVSLVTN